MTETLASRNGHHAEPVAELAAPSAEPTADPAPGAAVTRAQLADMRSVLDDMPVRVMLCDLDLHIEYVNKATRTGLARLAEHLPIDPSEIVGANIDIFHKNPAHQRRVLSSDANLPVNSIIQVGPETLDLTVQAVYDDAGTFCGAMATWELITERLELERRKAESDADLAAVAQVLESLAGARTSAEAMRVALDTARAELGWDYGTFWTLGDDDRLHFGIESGNAPEEFRQATYGVTYTPGLGLSGRAWRDRDLVYVPELRTLADCPRRAVAERVGVTTAVCVPVTRDGVVIGTMELASTDLHQLSDQRLDTLRQVGSLVSQAMERGARFEAEAHAAELLKNRVDLMLEVVSAAAQGDLTREIPVVGEDAIGRLGEGLGSLLTTLRTSMAEISRTADTLASAAEQLTSVSAQLSEGAAATSGRATSATSASEQVSNSIQTVATAAEEMTASIGEIARNASDAATVATTAVGVAAGAQTTVTSLGESSAEIGQVIKVITSIAQQTNLLALNATIEAARAGDAGKGFAVVANEVKELAKETAKATEDIGRKIEAIQTDTRGAVEGIGEIATIIDRISDIQTTIASAVEEQTATTNEIARSVTEAAGGATGISTDISRVADAARDSLQGSSDAKEAAGSLAEMAVELKQLLGQFHY